MMIDDEVEFFLPWSFKLSKLRFGSLYSLNTIVDGLKHGKVYKKMNVFRFNYVIYNIFDNFIKPMIY